MVLELYGKGVSITRVLLRVRLHRPAASPHHQPTRFITHHPRRSARLERVELPALLVLRLLISQCCRKQPFVTRVYVILHAPGVPGGASDMHVLGMKNSLACERSK
jgi:hypothetical protein